MVLSFGLWLVILGVLAAANLIIARKPDAAALIGKISPYQGWMGAVSVLYGVWELISCVGAMGMMAVRPPIGLILWVMYLANALLQIVLGFLLGVGVLKTFIKSEQANQKMDQTLRKLAPLQGSLGILAIVVGLAFVVLEVVFG